MLAGLLGVRPDEHSLTATGTTAVHLGVLGLLLGRRRTSGRLLHTAVEHSAVFAAGTWWERHHDGVGEAVPVDEHGRVRLEALAAALDEPAGVLACQVANPEVGTLQPLAEVAELAARAAVPVFADAAAAAGQVPLPAGWDVAAASAHKWGGPAGVGVLLVRKGTRWRAPFPTDERVDPRVAGFENVPDVEVVGHPTERLPHVVTFSCLYVEGEALVTALDRHGFPVASGSACTASRLEPSHVLAAMGRLTHGNVRVSLGHRTTESDVDRFLAVLPGVVADLRR